MPRLPDLRLDRRSSAPLHQQIYRRVRGAILSGGLPPGARLPSTRSLAAQLVVSRATAEAAYARLAGEGYVIGHGAAGTRVAPELARARSRQPARPSSRRAAPMPRRADGPDPGLPVLPFQMGLPALDAFPRKLWARLLARQARALAAPSLIGGEAAGHAALRAAVAGYIGIARGVACTTEQVVITAGFQGALGLITAALLRPGDAAWTEDPGYAPARRALALAGARIVPVPVDQQGLDVTTGIHRAPAARLALVTPSHQSPLGVALSLPRRLALIDWARRAKAWIVEDDYDGEYHYRGPPLPALQSLDGAGCVIYVGTFSKTLYPGLRLGYAVVPNGIVDRIAAAAALLRPPPSALEQTATAAFIVDGHFGRHVRHMRTLYAARRAALIAALADSPLRPDAHAGGLHVVARLPTGVDDRRVAARAAAAGLAPAALSAAAVDARSPPALLLGFTNLDVEAARPAVRRLLSSIRR